MSESPASTMTEAAAAKARPASGEGAGAAWPFLPPTRGLVPLHNRKGQHYADLDLRRWLRINRVVHKTAKVDLLAHGAVGEAPASLFELARELDMRLSLRTDASVAPPDLDPWRAAGLLDVFVAPVDIASGHVDAWFDACRRAGLPVRAQVLAPLEDSLDPEALAERLADAGVVSVSVSAHDPFLRKRSAPNAQASARSVEKMNRLVRALDERGIDASLLGLPFCQADRANWPHVLNRRQCAMDPAQYQPDAYELARNLFPRRRLVANKALLILQTRHMLHRTRVDDRLFPWILHRPWYNIRLAAWRRLTRHLSFFRSVPPVFEHKQLDYERAMALNAEERLRTLGPECARCSLRRVCDRITPPLRRALPGLAPTAHPGDPVTSPVHFSMGRRRHYDEVDAARRVQDERVGELAEEARAILANRSPDRLLQPTAYGVEDSYYIATDGGVRWFSVTNSEKLSTPLGRFQPPFTLSVTFAGAMPDYVGFSVGREGRLLCPMETFQHEVTLHADREGQYVLLRDGKPMRPLEFQGSFYVPPKMGSVVEPRIAIWNIEDPVITQSVRIWEGAPLTLEQLAPIKYSVVVVCSRYTRRLQATLRQIGHQEGIDLRQIEVIVGYVPGLDATDDLLDSMQLAFPDLRIVRVPFPPEKARSKGFMINEATKCVSGEWAILLDADILLPPNMFQLIEHEGKNTHFLFPDGRKMLSRETTAKILLGEIEPWRQWQELLDGPGEYRHREAAGLPIGFFQCVRAFCLESVKYEEMEHFEYADAEFGRAMREKYGMEKRMLGVPVLHLDHGASRWYGTQQHF